MDTSQNQTIDKEVKTYELVITEFVDIFQKLLGEEISSIVGNLTNTLKSTFNIFEGTTPEEKKDKVDGHEDGKKHEDAKREEKPTSTGNDILGVFIKETSPEEKSADMLKVMINFTPRVTIDILGATMTWTKTTKTVVAVQKTVTHINSEVNVGKFINE